MNFQENSYLYTVLQHKILCKLCNKIFFLEDRKARHYSDVKLEYPSLSTILNSSFSDASEDFT